MSLSVNGFKEPVKQSLNVYVDTGVSLLVTVNYNAAQILINYRKKTKRCLQTYACITWECHDNTPISRIH